MQAFVVVAVAVLTCVAGLSVPTQVPLCKRSDPKRDECLRDYLQYAIKYIENGVPKYKLPKTEPIFIEKVTIEQGASVVRVTQNYNNFYVYDFMKTVKIENLNSVITDKEFKLNFNASCPETYMISDYDFNGEVLSLPVVGNGKCKIVTKGIKAQAALTGKIYEKEGQSFVEIEDFDYKIAAEDGSFQFDNLFNGNEKLGKEMNNLLNENWKQVFNDAKPGYEVLFGTVFKSYFNLVLSKVPYLEAFPL